MNSPDMIVVSGAGTGIGRAVSRRLVADGFHVLAVGRRPEPLERLAKELAPTWAGRGRRRRLPH